METLKRKKNKPIKKSTAQAAAMDILSLDTAAAATAAVNETQSGQGIETEDTKRKQKEKKKKQRFTVYPTDHIWTCLKVKCTIEGKSMTAVACDILDEYFKDYDYEKEKAKAMQIIAQDIL